MKTVECYRVKCGSRKCASFGRLMEAIYCIFALIIYWIWSRCIIWSKLDFLSFLLKSFFFFKPTYIQLLIEKSMVEAIVKMFFFFKWRVWSLFRCTACSDIHTTQCSGGQDIKVKIIKTLAAKELKAFLWFLKKLSWCSLTLYALDMQNIHVSHQLMI